MTKLIFLPLIAGSLAAQAPAVHLIAAPDAQSRPIFGFVPAVRQLPGGKLLVNDIVKRQLTLLDPALGNPVIVADSAAGTPNSYGPRPGGLIAAVGDSSFFVDPAGLSMFVVDPAGKIARVASVPRSQDAAMIANNLLSSPGVDPKGRLVYRGGLTFTRTTQTQRATGGAPFAIPEPPDSAAILRVDVATRKLDTLTYFKIPKTKLKLEQTERGMSASSETNPMPIVDDWAVLTDGSIAIVRGQDYHVDFLGNDGAIHSAAKIPYDWQRLTDDDKVAVIDSAKKAVEAAAAAAANGTANPANNPSVAAGGSPRVMMTFSGPGSTDGGGGLAQRMMANGMGGGSAANVSFVSPSELPDYRPVFTAGAVRADADGNVWVRTTATRAGAPGPIYDVVNGKGELVDRVQLPAGRQIVGFGKAGIVYMVARDANGNWIERTHR